MYIFEAPNDARGTSIVYVFQLIIPFYPLPVIREKPLVIYVFSNSNKLVKEFRSNTTSGGFCSNETIMHCGGISLLS